MGNRMKKREPLDLLAQCGALITGGHFVYTSGKHGSDYVNKDAIYPHTTVISELCELLARKFADAQIETVAAPALGGIIMSQWLAHHLTRMRGREVLAVYAEKDAANGFVIRRGFDKLIRDKNILIVEDVLTTGGSVKKVADLVASLGGRIVGVAALCNRGEVSVGEVPTLYSLVNLRLEAWEPSECPLCEKKIPINSKLGKGKA